MKTKKVKPAPALEAFRLDFLTLLNRYTGAAPAEQMLATAAYAVGQLILYQDAARFTPAELQQLVWENIAEGNRMALEAAIATSGGRQ